MIAWHFAPDDRRLRYGDGSPDICRHGLHASARAIDALARAPGAWVSIVRLGGEIVVGVGEACATERTYLAGMDAAEVLWAWDLWCALRVVHLWDMPPVVRQYLETGDEALRAVAEVAL